MMDWKALVGTVAPWIGAALGGPMGAAAVGYVADALGLSEKTESAVKAALAGVTPEQMLAIKTADQNFALAMQKLGFDHQDRVAELQYKDVDSARNREIAVKDNTNKILAYTVVSAFLAMVAATLMGYAKVESVLAGTLVGYLSAKAEQVLAYYFGSSAGSQRKTELIAQAPAIEK